MKKLFIIIFLICLNCHSAEFSHESEASILSSGGNSVFSSYNFKVNNDYKLSQSIYQLSGHYTYGTAGNLVSARNWDGKLGYERVFKKSLTGFLSQQVEADKFKGIESRYNSDLGAGFILYKSDKHEIKTELGYRYTIEKHEDLSLGDNNFQKGRLHTENTHKITESLFFKFWVEYIPNFTVGSDYMFNFGSSLQVTLTKYFSLKVAYEGDYDNLPSKVSNKKFDYQYTTSLIARF